MLYQVPQIYYIRHGQTDWNKQNRFQGRRDIPLNITGEAQADANGGLLKKLIARHKHDIANLAWLASPLGRTMDTANRVRAAFDDALLQPLKAEPDLVEISFGRMEGYRLQDLEHELPHEYAARLANKWTHRPLDGENYDDVAQRVTRVLAKLKGPTIIVSHGGVGRIFDHLICDAGTDVLAQTQFLQDHIYHYKDGQKTMHNAAAGTA